MSKCITKHRKKDFVLEENKRKAVFKNPLKHQVEEAKMDDCLITGRKERCDYYVECNNSVWYVELKGNKSEKGVSQIFSTAKHFAPRHKALVRIGVLVCTQVPAANSRVQKRLMQSIKKGKHIDEFYIRTKKSRLQYANDLSVGRSLALSSKRRVGASPPLTHHHLPEPVGFTQPKKRRSRLPPLLSIAIPLPFAPNSPRELTGDPQ